MSVRLNDLKSLKGHKAICWNSRSLVNEIEEVDRLVIEANPELIGITESWTNPTISNPEIAIDGYLMHRQDRSHSDRTRGGGLIWYVKNDLQIDTVEGVNTCTVNLELLWVKLNLTQTRPIYYGLVYRPPDGNRSIYS